MALNDPESATPPTTTESSATEAPQYRKRSISFATRWSPPPSKHEYPSEDDDQVSPGHVSSADEITPIASREQSTGAKRRNYSTTKRASSGEGSNNDNGKSQGAGGGDSRSKNGKQDDKGKSPAEGEEGGRGWWRDVVEKYGAVELENKGSVARDHLALGKSSMFLRLAESMLTIAIRTDIPRMAPYVVSIRLHRHCRHTTVSTQHHHQRERRPDTQGSTKYISSTSAGQAIGCNIFGDCDFGAFGRRAEVF